MIYDCFTFFNELDLLDIRLNELDDTVDYFVLVECKKTFSGKNKKLYFEENKSIFHKFLNKIIHIKLDDFGPINNEYLHELGPLPSSFTDCWKREIYQRDSIMKGLDKAKDDDIILIGDVDEIPDKRKFNQLQFNSNHKVYRFDQNFYYYFFNNKVDQKWPGTKAIQKKNISTPQQIRIMSDCQVIDNGGWHFSYLGSLNNIKKKISSFSHQELNTPDVNNLDRLKFNIFNGFDIFNRPLQLTFEKVNNQNFTSSLVKSIKKYHHLIYRPKKFDRNSLLLQNEVVSLRNKLKSKDLKLVEAEQKYMRLKSQFEEITDSFFFRFWKPYNLLKKILNNIRL